MRKLVSNFLLSLSIRILDAQINYLEMLLHNITFNVENNTHDQWLHFMKTEFVPQVMATNLPVKSLIMRLLTEIDNGGMTYSFQFQFNEMEDYMSFEMNYKDPILNNLYKKFMGKYVMFATLLEEVS